MDEDNNDWSPKYSPYEQECINYIETMPDTEGEFETEKCHYDRKQWNFFQNCALAIAQLYRADISNNVSNQHNQWNTFQQASTNVACLYKECSEFHKKLIDANYQNGYNKRTKELLTWAKKKKNHIRREELIAFLSGRSYPAGHGNYYHHRFGRNARQSRTSDDLQRFFSSANSANNRSNSRLLFNDAITDSNPLMSNSFTSTLDSDEHNLQTFREAISGLRNQSNILSNSNRRSPRNNVEDLSEFINQEYHRHVESRKRTASMDVCMDSPTHSGKRTKFC